jgi:protein tyrosine/serine phosphatase
LSDLSDRDPRPAPHAGWAIALEGSANFRDLGGWAAAGGRRVRRGRLYRSDALHRLTAADVALLRGLGVATVVDLRSSHEVEAEGRGPLCDPPARYHHVPFFDGERSGASAPPGDLAEIYFQMLRFAAKPIARALEVLAACEAPAVFHCAAGKDRTGVLAAVLLSALGVADEDVVLDYARTQAAMELVTARLRESDAYAYVFTELPPETLHARPETMRALLARARAEWGSLRDYARFAGVPDAALDALAARLVE